MNVHITCTPEFSFEKLEEIVSILNSIPGELKFIPGKPLTQAIYKRINKKFENIHQISSLSFEEYSDLVQGYREIGEQRELGKIDDADFVPEHRPLYDMFGKWYEKQMDKWSEVECRKFIKQSEKQ
jgi:hypothetical protein